MIEKLSDAARKTMLDPLLANGWSFDQGRDALRKDYKFASFVDAFGWMTRAAIWAEKWNHHPEWTNSFNRVTVVLTTHHAKGLSPLDVKLARKLDRLAETPVAEELDAVS